MTGYKGGGYISKIYRNNGTTFNTSPTSPSGLAATESGTSISFKWNRATDPQTPSPGLTYNLRIGTSLNGINTQSPMANLSNGYRKVVRLGNTNHDTSWTIKNLDTTQTYYWSVQAIDNSFAGSQFSAEQSFTFLPSPKVNSVSPSQNSLSISKSANISATFNVAMNTVTLNTSNILVHGSQSGKHAGTITLSGDTAFTFDPTTGFKAGEIVNVTLTKNITSASGDSLTNGWHWSFTIQNSVSTGTFTSSVEYATGFNPTSVFVSDVDSDGDCDIVTSNLLTSTISVLKNNGDGTFTTKVDYATGNFGNNFFSVTVDDIDGDGDGDAVTANTNASSISVLMNNGIGTFATNVDYTTGGGPISVIIKDLDGDGDRDIVTENYASHTISVLKNNGDGTFALKVDYATGMTPRSAFLYDLDGDGDHDVLTANLQSESISVLKNNGDGTFATKVDYIMGNFGSSNISLTVSDVDEDGDGDMVTANGGNGSNTISILQNNGDGMFAPKVDYTAGTNPRSAFVSDIDGDGDGDVCVSNSNSISILKNNGDGSFTTNVEYAAGSNSLDVYVSDLDGDGDGDIVTANMSSNTISVLKNINATASISGTKFNDLNGNGIKDGSDGVMENWSIYLSSAASETTFTDINGNYSFTNLQTGTYTISEEQRSGWEQTFPVSPNTYSVTLSAGQDTTGFDFGNVQLFTITASAGANGSISPSGTITVRNGNDTAFTITPSSNYHIDSIIVDGVFIGTPTTYMFDSVTANHTIRAVFAINTFTITVTTPTNGTISPSGTFSKDYGSSQAFTVTPSTGYHIDSIRVGGAYVSNTSPYTLSNITAAHTVSATFAINTFTIIASAGPNGSISPNGNVTVNYGANQKFTNSPNSCYSVDSVIVDGLLVDSLVSYTFVNVSANHTITAKFRVNTYTITVTQGTNGTITPAISQFNCGASQQFCFTPNTGYHIDSVFVDNIYIGSLSCYTFNNITANHTLRVVYAITTYTITVIQGANGTITPGTSIVNYGASKQFTITPNSCYSIDSVIVDGIKNDSTTSYTFTNVTTNREIRATFKMNTYTITVIQGANGIISPATSIVNCGANQQFTISPNSCYSIDSVLVDGVNVGSLVSYTFNNVTANHTITAKFRVNTYTITVTQGANGIITPGTSIVNCGTNKQFTITPNSSYHLDSVIVDGGKVDSTTSYTFNNVTTNHTITAKFSLQRFVITATAGQNGSISPSGTVTVNYGENKRFTFSSVTGHHVDSVLVDGLPVIDSLAGYTFNNVIANHTIRVTFKLNTYSINATSGTGGNIDTTGNVVVNYGANQRFTFSSNNGYHVESVTVDGALVDSLVGYTFYNVTANHTIAVAFAITIQYPSISGIVFNDLNGNGLKGNLEPLLNNWKIYFYRNDSLSLVDSTVMNEEGFYKGALQPGTYYIRAVAQTGWVKTFPSGNFQTVTVDYGENATGITFGYYKTSSITVKTQLDADKDFSTANDRTTIQWRFSVSFNGNTIAQTNDTMLTVSALAPGTYLVEQIDSIYFTQLGRIVDGVATADTANRFVSVSVQNGKVLPIIFVTRYDPDTTRFRTIEASTLLSANPIKLKKGRDGKYPLPNIANIRDTIVKQNNGLIVGRAQGNKDSAKVYGWLQWKTGKDVGKFYTSEHTGRSYPLDSIRLAGKKTKKLSKVLKATRKAYNNPFAAEFAVFKMNLAGSQRGVFPKQFEELELENSASIFNGMMLGEIADGLDSAMTYWTRYSILKDSAAAEEIKILLQDINEAFANDIDDTTEDIKSISPLVLKGVTPLSEITFLKRGTKRNAAWNWNETNENGSIPEMVMLEQNYPNPFNPTTAIGFSLLAVGNVSLRVYDILGKEVTTLLNNEQMEEGEHRIIFEANNLPSGVYFYRLSVNGKFSETKKLVLMK